VGVSLAIAGLLVLVGGLGFFTFRTSLSIALLGGVAILARGAARSAHGIWRLTVAVYAGTILLAAVPVDLRLANTGRLGVNWVPYVWGLPSMDQHGLAKKGQIVAPGCIVPAYPARYAILLTW
jgi:hypothetical protein